MLIRMITSTGLDSPLLDEVCSAVAQFSIADLHRTMCSEARSGLVEILTGKAQAQSIQEL